MQKAQAQNKIKETFENHFEEARFRDFVRNLLNHIEEEDGHPYSGQFIATAFQPYISTLKRIGKYSDGEHEIDILIVQLKKFTSLERARTAQRNFIARYLNGSRGGKMKDAALVAFVSPNEADWRFSLIKMDYKFIEGKNGKTKVKEEFTPARRWSFLVGPNEHSHTAQAKLAPIIEDENVITLARLEEAFNIEKVTKEFFEKYRDLFLRTKEALDELVENDERLRDDFQNKFINTADFTKKLLGQIVFLYFLQKKGWFGVEQGKDWGTGSKGFMRDLFEGKIISYKNFFNNVLEHLFYDALARDRSDIDHFNPHFNCKIPFLNGGLFDPINGYSWEKTEIELPNDLFSNDYFTKEKDKGTGILDIFDRYNFTVKEDEPLEKEVAVDPEMLGKVFENLLEVKDRKSKGTYYTPREIVHYMCEQSLVNYLATELSPSVIPAKAGIQPPTKEDLEKLIKYGENVAEHEAVSTSKEDNPDYGGDYKRLLPDSIKEFAGEIDNNLATIKVCDPAIGSGAFPVGMMNAIVKTRIVLNESYIKDKNKTPYTFKRDCIQNSLYGVDIDPGAVEIAKLRLWLSLVVDEDNIKQIKPLPNLDYKIMQGNSLLEEFEGIKLFDEKLIAMVDNGKEKQLETLKQKQAILQKEYFELHSQNKLTPAKQAELNTELKKLQTHLKKLNNAGLPAESSAKVGLFDAMSEAKRKADDLKRLHKEFFEATQKSKKDNIKKQIEQLEWELIEATLKEQGKTSALKKLEEFKRLNTKPFFLWKLNFTDVFEGKGGFDVVIANPPYIGEKGHKESFSEIKNSDFLGKFYLGKMDFFYFFFHLALNLGNASSQIAFITTNYYPTASGAKKLREDFKNRAIIRRLINFNDLRIFESAMGQHNMVTILSKGQNNQVVAKTAITKQTGTANSKILSEIVSWQDSGTEYFNVIQEDLFDDKEYYIRLSGASSDNSGPIQILLNKIKLQGNLLGTICNVNNGVFAGADKLNADKRNKYKINDASVGEGIFILSNQEVRDNNFSDVETKIIKPLFKNSDIKKFYTNTKNELNLINLRYTDRPDLNDYPKIKAHLKRFEKLLTDRPRTGTLESAFKNGYWYVMSTSRKLNFNGSKIVFPQRSNTNTFGYNEVTWYAMSDVFFITQKEEYNKIDLKYILALLNSKLYYLWLYHRGKRKGDILELTGTPVSEVPIKIVGKDTQKSFIQIVDKILEITKSDNYSTSTEKQAKVRDLEHQIDELVYKLYGLTDEEIKIVEAK